MIVAMTIALEPASPTDRGMVVIVFRLPWHHRYHGSLACERRAGDGGSGRVIGVHLVLGYDARSFSCHARGYPTDIARAIDAGDDGSGFIETG